MEREEYIKSHNLEEISLILTSFKEKGLVGINYMALHDSSYVVISTSSSFEKSDILKPQEKLFKLDGDKIKKENNPFYEIGMFSCKVDFECDKYSSNKFYYYVVGRGYKSTIHSFEMCSNKDDYYFYSFVDLQHGFNNLTHPLIKKIKEIKYAPLMLNSGDLSAVSADYNEWKWMVNGGLFDNVLFNSAVGDHEYWADYNVHASLMAEPYPFMYCMNNPLNGPYKEKGKSY